MQKLGHVRVSYPKAAVEEDFAKRCAQAANGAQGLPGEACR